MERQMSLVDQKCSTGNGKGKGSYDGPEVVLKTMGGGGKTSPLLVGSHPSSKSTTVKRG